MASCGQRRWCEPGLRVTFRSHRVLGALWWWWWVLWPGAVRHERRAQRQKWWNWGHSWVIPPRRPDGDSERNITALLDESLLCAGPVPRASPVSSTGPWRRGGRCQLHFTDWPVGSARLGSFSEVTQAGACRAGRGPWRPHLLLLPVGPAPQLLWTHRCWMPRALALRTLRPGEGEPCWLWLPEGAGHALGSRLLPLGVAGKLWGTPLLGL